MKGHRILASVAGLWACVFVLALSGFSAASANTAVEVDINGRVIGSDVNVDVNVGGGHSTPPTTSPPPPVGDHDVPPVTAAPPPTKPQNRPPATKQPKPTTPPPSAAQPNPSIPASQAGTPASPATSLIPAAGVPRNNSSSREGAAGADSADRPGISAAALIEQGEIGPGTEAQEGENATGSSGIDGVPFPFIGDGGGPAGDIPLGLGVIPRSTANPLVLGFFYALAVLCVLVACYLGVVFTRSRSSMAIATTSTSLPPPPPPPPGASIREMVDAGLPTPPPWRPRPQDRPVSEGSA